MNNEDPLNRLIEHVLSIVESITIELKDQKQLSTDNDKRLALIDQRLAAAERILTRIEKVHNDDRFNNAKKDGGDIVRWAIIGFIGFTALGLIVTAAFNVLAKV